MQRNNKILSGLLSLFIAFGLWLYVVNFVSLEHTDTIYGIPVVYEGETVLTERKLMITSGKDATVNLTLTGSRSDLVKVNKNNITLKVELNKIYNEGVHNLTYDIIYPGDVPSNAFVEENKSPSAISITVEQKDTKNVPVRITYNGSTVEGFLVDKENAVMDYPEINVSGPVSVVDQIDHASIVINLDSRTESISESYRYTLCDVDGNPVDVAQVTTNTAEVRLDLPIRRFVESALALNVNYGGGTTEQTAKITIDPETIQMSGSDALLEELTQINLGTIDLATITEDQTLTFPINLPEGVTNETGVTEATVTVEFSGLSIEEFDVNRIDVINVPAGMEYDLLNKVVKVTLRGPTALMKKISAEDIAITVDLSDKELGSSTVKAEISIDGTGFEDVGALGSYSVSVTLKEAEEEVT